MTQKQTIVFGKQNGQFRQAFRDIYFPEIRFVKGLKNLAFLPRADNSISLVIIDYKCKETPVYFLVCKIIAYTMSYC